MSLRRTTESTESPGKSAAGAPFRERGPGQLSKRELKLALDAAEIGAWTWSVETGLITWEFGASAAQTLGPLQGKTSVPVLLTFIDAADVDFVQHTLARMLADGDVDIEFRIRPDQRQVRWIEIRGRAVERDLSGKPLRIVGIVLDVTGRKRLEEERLRLVQLETAMMETAAAERAMAETLERITDGFIAIDREFQVTVVNGRAVELVGGSRDELIGTDLRDILPILIDESEHAGVIAACTAEEPESFDVIQPGGRHAFEVRIFPGQDGATMHVRDVTDLRVAEQQRRTAESRFRSLVQSASDVILIIDRAGRIQFASPAVERIVGLRPADVVGTDVGRLVFPADLKRLRRTFLRTLRWPGLGSPIELRVEDRAGGIRWLEVTPTNLMADPAIGGIVAYCRDVTERHVSEFNLWLLSEISAVIGSSLDLAETLRGLTGLVVTSLGDLCAVDVVDDEGRLNRVAASRRGGSDESHTAEAPIRFPMGADESWSAADIVALRRAVVYQESDVAAWSDRPAVKARLARLDSLGIRSAVVAPVISHGVVRGVVTIASEEPTRFTTNDIGIVEEIARRAALAIENARLYQHAQDAIEARDTFLSVAAHEIRTPITSVSGYAAMLRKEMSNRRDPDRIARYVDRLSQAGERLSDLAEDLLDISRIRVGQLPFRLGPVDLSGLLRQVVQQGAVQRDGPPRDVRLLGVDEPAVVHADSDRLEQVFANLLDNAIKYSLPSEPIEIELRATPGGVLISVRDRGIGIASGELHSVFSPFSRATNAMQSDIPGLGLGLSICRAIVERHGGRIWAESEGPGLGATLMVMLPETPDGYDATAVSE